MEVIFTADERHQLLTIGVFLVVIVAALLLASAQVISWWLLIPFVLVAFGIWLLALAAMRGANPPKYGRGPFSTAILGLLIVALGGSWYLFGINWVYSIALILLVLAAAAIAAALKRK